MSACILSACILSAFILSPLLFHVPFENSPNAFRGPEPPDTLQIMEWQNYFNVNSVSFTSCVWRSNPYRLWSIQTLKWQRVTSPTTPWNATASTTATGSGFTTAIWVRSCTPRFVMFYWMVTSLNKVLYRKYGVISDIPLVCSRLFRCFLSLTVGCPYRWCLQWGGREEVWEIPRTAQQPDLIICLATHQSHQTPIVQTKKRGWLMRLTMFNNGITNHQTLHHLSTCQKPNSLSYPKPTNQSQPTSLNHKQHSSSQQVILD